jgi:NAD(P)-dependent dehydrogenase (short-subunit alcohol dehydrogenase family)
MSEFKGKVVLLTGAATGLGAETAHQFAEQGSHLVLVDINAEGLQQTADAIRAAGAKVETVTGDVSKAATCATALARAKEKFGRLDILINNAGIDPLSATNVVDTTEQQWDAIMSVNLRAAFLFCKAAIPVMIASGGGAIVNTSSLFGVRAGVQETAYAVSKAALVQLTKCVALDYAGQGIRSNCVCPGMLEDIMGDRKQAMSSTMIAARYKAAESAVPMGRQGRYQEVAQSILFLASSSRAAYITGVALSIDGGSAL